MTPAALALLACRSQQGPRDSVLLITVDTLRADHLSPYNGEVPTPATARLAAEGVVYERAYAPMGLTRPSHGALLTGRYPREIGVLNNATALPGDVPTLAERLAADGYQTGAFTSVRLLDASSGIARGFATLDAPTVDQRPGGVAVARALDWLTGLDNDAPFLLWVHLFKPHLPYAPPAPLRGTDPELWAALPAVDWPQLVESADEDGDVPWRIAQHARRLYAAEVAGVDAWIGALTDGVEERRGARPVLRILTADHGEGMECGVFFEHADSLCDGVLRVPLIVSAPTRSAGRSDRVVSLVDVAPTVLQTLGRSGESASGVPLLESPSTTERAVFIEHPYYQPSAVMGRTHRREQIRSVADRRLAPLHLTRPPFGVVGAAGKLLDTAGLRVLVSSDADVGAGLDRAAESPAAAAALGQALDGFLRSHPIRPPAPETLNSELRQTLEALGYL